MRLFIITSLMSEFKVVEPCKIILNDNNIDVVLNFWATLEQFKTHGDVTKPLKTEVFNLQFDFNQIDNLLNFIYNQISILLPDNEIIYHKPRE